MCNLSNKKIMVAGNGISGKGAAFALKKTGAYFNVCEGDFEREIEENDYSLIVVSPGISSDSTLFSAAKSKNIPVIAEIELGYLLNKGKILAVTGTNGKTTVAKMAALMLGEKHRVALCGNIGRSFSEVASLGGYEIAVVEVSSFQLETVHKFHPDVAVLTNISEDHLDRHGSMERYIALKKKIAKNMTSGDTLVLSQDGIPIKCLMNFSPEAKVVFACVRGKIQGAYMEGDEFFLGGNKIAEKKDLPFTERHNYENFLLAAAASSAIGASAEEIRRGIAKFTPEKHRLCLVREIGGVKFYDDSKATNVAATIAALAEMKGSVCLIAGGSDKKCDFSQLFSTHSRLKQINLIGETGYKIRDAAYMNGFAEAKLFDDLESAVKNAYKSGCDNVLFSPACASFDMFENYSARGEKFVESVYALV